MKGRGLIRPMLIGFGITILGCSATTGEDPKKSEKVGKPPVAVEVFKVAASTVSEGIDVVGSL